MFISHYIVPIVLTDTNRESALSRDNVTLQFVISAYPRVEESSIRLQFQQDNSGTITEVTCGGDIQLSGRSRPIGEVSCERNNSRVFVTLSEVTLEAAGRYTLMAGNSSIFAVSAFEDVFTQKRLQSSWSSSECRGF